MTNPTSNFGWQMPTPTDLVTDLPADFEVFGQAVDTSMADLKGGTTGQILSKATNTDMDFAWIANDQGDITGVTATTPLTGGGTSGALTIGIQDATTSVKGAVQLSDSTSTISSILASTPTATKSAYDLANAAIPKSTVTTAGDTIYATGSSAVTRLGIGSTGQVLTVAAGIPSWATPASGSTFVGVRLDTTVGVTLPNNTNLRIPYDAETFDTSNFHSTTVNNTRITIPAGKAGYYYFYSSMSVNTGVAGELRFVLNGSTLNRNDTYGTGTLPVSYQGATVLNLIVGDYVEVDMYQNSGSSKTLISFNFLAYYLGA